MLSLGRALSLRSLAKISFAVSLFRFSPRSFRALNERRADRGRAPRLERRKGTNEEEAEEEHNNKRQAGESERARTRPLLRARSEQEEEGSRKRETTQMSRKRNRTPGLPRRANLHWLSVGE